MTDPCVFCDRDPSLEARIFYDRANWYALLAVPPNATGHAILALKSAGALCPRKLLRANMHGLDMAVADVVEALQKYYEPKDVLVASLRAQVPHVHWHLIPLWEEQEAEWRRQSSHERGHLFEFLGDIDKAAQSRAREAMIERGWSDDEQRDHLTKTVGPAVNALRALTGYTPR